MSVLHDTVASYNVSDKLQVGVDKYQGAQRSYRDADIFHPVRKSGKKAEQSKALETPLLLC